MHLGNILALATVAGAVRIQLFLDSTTGDSLDCMGDNRVECLDIAEGECCPIPSYMTADSALFSGLNTGMGYGGFPAYGVTYKPDGNDDECTTSCETGFGRNVCLGCGDGVEGANWFQMRPARKRDGSMALVKPGSEKCKRAREPTLLSLRDAHFNIGEAAGVPVEDSKEFYALLSRGAVTLQDVTERLLVHRDETFVARSGAE